MASKPDASKPSGSQLESTDPAVPASATPSSAVPASVPSSAAFSAVEDAKVQEPAEKDNAPPRSGVGATAVFIGATSPGTLLTPSDILPRNDIKATSEIVGSWFKKSCREVALPLVRKNLKGRDDVFNHRGFSYEAGPDKVPTVFTSNENLWNSTSQIINYFFMEGNELQQRKVTEVIAEWTWYANVVFSQASSAEQSNVRIRFDPGDGSRSYVGRQCGSIATIHATMNLAWLNKFSPLNTNERAVILHEFGHVLGLLHEHQSPAHGGCAVKNIEAAFDLYSKTREWSKEQILEQVINFYQMSDVSNFSQVDTRSIMHYPQPKELTGLGYDIPYNEKLTDIDKAYMILQYPRREMHPKAANQGWTFSKALKVIEAPPHVTDQVLGFIESDRNELSGEISPTNIRNTIEEWCRATYKGQDTKPLASTFNPAHTVAKASQLGRVSGKVQDGQDFCSTDDSDDSAGSGLGKPAHAITSEDVLWPLPTDGSPTPLKVSYIIRAHNLHSSSSSTATKDQEAMIQTALDIWSGFAGVRFVPATIGKPVDLVIQFNNTVKVEPEGSLRSSCSMPTGSSKIARRNDDARKDWDSVKTDIEYNGIFSDLEEARKYKSTTFKSESDWVDGYTLNMRSILHELGHWLGLRHEYCGLYGYWMDNQMGKRHDKKFNDSIAKTFWATRFDAGSIMDAIGIRLQDAAMDVLRLKGLQPASVTQLQDIDNVFHRVNLAVNLSPYDQANIALLYPGTTNLVEAEGNSFELKLSKEDPSQSILKKLLKSLQLFTDMNLESISAPLCAGKWQAARKAYLDILKQQQMQEACSLQDYKQFVSSELTVSTTGVKGVFNVALTHNGL